MRIHDRIVRTINAIPVALLAACAGPGAIEPDDPVRASLGAPIKRIAVLICLAACETLYGELSLSPAC